MTDLTLVINGTDYSDIVTKHKYASGRKAVLSYSYTDLDKVRHQYVKRWVGSLQVDVNPLTTTKAAQLYASLTTQPCTVKYHSFQTGADVTSTMVPSDTTMEDAKAFSDGRFIQGFTLSFEEL